MSKSKKESKTYDKKYYLAQYIIHDKWFLERVEWLKNEFKKIECPIPEKGFKSEKAYENWRSKYWTNRDKKITGKEYKKMFENIVNDKNRSFYDVSVNLDSVEKLFWPPVFGEFFKEILKHYKIKKDDRLFYNFIHRYVFFGYKEYRCPKYRICLRRDEQTREPKMFIEIFGYTKKKDIINDWKSISKYQKSLPDYLEINTKWTESEKDFEIYHLYNEIKMSGKKYVDRLIFNELGKKHNLTSRSQIRNIISKFKNRFDK